ncbi:MAG: EamA family transporter RarD [Rhodobacter sp.]|nr:EamA family transporter RarD [Rhodobacter sp.]
MRASEAAKGIAAMIAACLIWGLSPIFYKLLAHVPPLEVLSHRTIWSLVLFGLVLAAQGRVAEIARVLGTARGALAVLLAAATISVNWGLFIWAIQVGRTVETSLGYFVYPLVSVLFGVVLLRERLSGAQWAAVGLAAFAVAVLTWGLGAAPWVSLTLAASFGVYGVIKKFVTTGPVVSVTTEVLILMPLAAVWLWGVHNQGWIGPSGRNLGTFGHSLSDSLVLMLSGPLTAAPLILFSYASRRITMATVGLVQYLNPTLQFLVATLVFAEPFTRWHGIAFPLIWVALGAYSLSAIRQERSLRRAATSSGTSSTTPT